MSENKLFVIVIIVIVIVFTITYGICLPTPHQLCEHHTNHVGQYITRTVTSDYTNAYPFLFYVQMSKKLSRGHIPVLPSICSHNLDFEVTDAFIKQLFKWSSLVIL